MEKEVKDPQVRIAESVERQQKLYEIDVLCKVAETAKSLAKCSITDFHDQAYVDAEMLIKVAIAKSKELLNEEQGD